MLQTGVLALEGVFAINRKSFINELKNLLAFMEPEERARAVARYEAMFDEAGEEGEEGLIRCLGSPVRLVLQLEKEYRDALNNGETPFPDGVVVEKKPAEESDEILPGVEVVSFEEVFDPETAPVAEPEKAAVPKPETSAPAEEAPAPAVEPAPPAEPETLAEENFVLEPEETVPAAVAAVPAAAMAEPAEETAPVPATVPAEAPAPVKEAPAAEASVRAEPEQEKGPSGGRVFGAVLVTIPMIAVWIILFGISLVLGAAVIAVAAAFCFAGVYLAGYIFSGALPFTPDLLLVIGGALVAFALALLFMWLGLWIAIGGIIDTVKLSRSIYRGILGKKKEANHG